VTASGGGGIEHFSHDLLLCSLFMLHFKGLSVIINSPPKQNEYVSGAGGEGVVESGHSRLKYWVGSGECLGGRRCFCTMVSSELYVCAYNMRVYSQEREELRRDFASPVMISGAKY